MGQVAHVDLVISVVKNPSMRVIISHNYVYFTPGCNIR